MMIGYEEGGSKGEEKGWRIVDSADSHLSYAVKKNLKKCQDGDVFTVHWRAEGE